MQSALINRDRVQGGRRVWAGVWLLLTMILLAQTAQAQPERCYVRDGVAIKGYDPVAYHREGKARKGDSTHQASYDDAVWHFVSAENRALFEEEPAKYAPAYGGYDAFFMAEDRRARVDPEDFMLHEGRLFLFKDRGAMSVFRQDLARNIAKADYWYQQFCNELGG